MNVGGENLQVILMTHPALRLKIITQEMALAA